ncbi:unnamed protein product [Acanthoscelides obtectus]|uniref:HTH CENPB-type domain-containing protein n=1 Tax=Acanthoscelides obtectus TaxID=200917 RepID=A0A9P0K8C5_ACAOB|nr:unnamed protein product [Acanthoscelides obtectus]CAK1655979.1 hypothetical protein AOBTE_LOCUS19485 [Acanthoscelides obtectus]
MSVYKASQTFNVPKTTLRDKRDGKYKNEKCGVQPVLSRDEERTIVEWIVHLAALGFPVTKSQLLENVSNLVKNSQCLNPFKDEICLQKCGLNIQKISYLELLKP